MKTLAGHHKAQLEQEVLQSIMYRPSFLEIFDLQENDFGGGRNSKIFSRMLELRIENKEINIMNLYNPKLTVDDLAGVITGGSFFSESTPFQNPRDFINACQMLREDNTKRRITRLAEGAETVEEFINEMRNIEYGSVERMDETFDKQLDRYLENKRKLRERQLAGAPIGLFTGWRRFNELVAVQPGELFVIGARPSIGKTSIALDIGIEAAALGQRVLFASMEMPEDQIFDKIFAYLNSDPIWKYKYGKASEEEIRREAAVIRERFLFRYRPKLTTTQLARIISLEGKLDVVIVDYLQLLKDKNLRGDSENNRLGRVSGNLKMLAGEHRVVMIVPAQLNRGNEKEKREPILSDLRDSGCIEQDADIVALLHRTDRAATSAKLIIAKNRNGKTGVIDFWFTPEASKFEEANEIIND